MFPLSISISDPVDDEGDDINQELERKAEEQALQVIALLKVCIDSCVYIQALRSNQTVILEMYTDNECDIVSLYTSYYGCHSILSNRDI